MLRSAHGFRPTFASAFCAPRHAVVTLFINGFATCAPVFGYCGNAWAALPRGSSLTGPNNLIINVIIDTEQYPAVIFCNVLF